MHNDIDKIYDLISFNKFNKLRVIWAMVAKYFIYSVKDHVNLRKFMDLLVNYIYMLRCKKGINFLSLQA